MSSSFQSNSIQHPIQIGCEVNIDNTLINPVLSLQITQQHGCHNKLSLRFYHDRVQTEGDLILHDAASLFGKVVEVIIKDKLSPDGDQFVEKFVITSVALDQHALAEGVLLLEALSPTYLLDGMPHYESFNNRTLSDIVKQVCYPMESVKGWQKIDPAFTDTLTYVCRFNETAWNFLKRLAASLGEWIFSDGTQLVFGKANNGKAIQLMYGSDTYDVKMKMNSVPLQSSFFDYDAAAHNNMAATAAENNGSSGSYAQSKAFERSKLLFAATTATMPQQFTGKSPLDTMGASKASSSAAGMYTVSGSSTNFRLRVGALVDLSFKREGQSATHGQLRVTTITHHWEVTGKYSNQFEAIPSDAAPPFIHFHQPATHSMLGEVVDNADPLGQGRVRVSFLGWQQANPQKTDWIRVLMTDAGSGLAGKNRGHVFVPEKGDQVLVDFIGNNPDNPIVTGSVHHGGNAAGGATENHLKTIVTRSGVKVQFDDTDGKGSITITDPSGNSWYMDGKGNITVNAPKNMGITVGVDLNISVGNNFTTSVGKDMATTVTENNNTTVGANNTLMITELYKLITDTYNQSVGKDKKVRIGGDLKETTSTTTHKALNGDVHIQSAGVTTILGSIDAKVNKG